MAKIITVGELKDLMQLEDDLQIIDVRNEEKLVDGVIPGAKHIQADTVPDRLDEIDKSRPVYVHCVLGIKSLEVVDFLEHEGYDAFSLDGGYQSWMSGVASPQFS